MTEVGIPPALDGTFGRLRGARIAPDGALFVSTSNGGDDVVLRVEPHFRAIGPYISAVRSRFA